MFGISSYILYRFQRTYLTACRGITLGALLIILAACQLSPTGQASPAFTSVIIHTPTGVQISVPTLSAVSTPSPYPSVPTATSLIQTGELKGVTIAFWFTVDQTALPHLLDLIAEFNETNPWGVQVEPVPLSSYGVMQERFDAARQEGELPGLVAAYTEQMLYWDAGAYSLLDLSRYMDDAVWGLSTEEVHDFYAEVWEREGLKWKVRGAQDGLRIGLPWYRSGTLLVYNQTWAEELGFAAPPSTPDELQRQACAAASANRQDGDRENDGSGGLLISQDASVLLSWVFAFGGQIVQQGGQGYHFVSPEFKQALQYLHNLYTEGCAWQSDDPVPSREFANRKALFLPVSVRELLAVQQALIDVGNQDVWIVLPFPSPEGPAVLEVHGPSLILLKSAAEEQLAAWLFARWLVLPEIQAEWVSHTGYFPTRISAMARLKKEDFYLPQQWSALRLLPLARAEPAFASWYMVRWSLQDMMRQLLTPDFQSSQIDDLVKDLDLLASELFLRYR